MSLSAATLGSVFQDVFDFLATDDPLFLTPAGGGDPVKFMHGLRSADVNTSDQDTTVPTEFIAWTMEPLSMGGVYTYNGVSWTVTRDNHHKAGGPVAPTNPNVSFSYLLTRHAQ